MLCLCSILHLFLIGAPSSNTNRKHVAGPSNWIMWQKKCGVSDPWRLPSLLYRSRQVCLCHANVMSFDDRWESHVDTTRNMF